jgi:ATP phosphoribosyltransferase
VATSYPGILRRFLADHSVDARIVEISGSVEIAPALSVADAICDLVSTGATLRANGLREVTTVLKSESVVVRTKRPLSSQKEGEIARLLQRIEGVVRAEHAKYIMMNAPRSALEAIRALLPGMEEPTIMPLGGKDDRIAIHAVALENVFWETMENLKRAGASSILVVPIEKII